MSEPHRPRGRRLKREPTAEELERCIAEQMERLPSFWWADCERFNGPEFAELLREEYETQRRRAT